MQVIGLLSLLVELQAGKIGALERDVPTMTFAPGQSQIVGGEVLALVKSVQETAGIVLNTQSTVDPFTVRTPALFITTATHFTR